MAPTSSTHRSRPRRTIRAAACTRTYRARRRYRKRRAGSTRWLCRTSGIRRRSRPLERGTSRTRRHPRPLRSRRTRWSERRDRIRRPERTDRGTRWVGSDRCPARRSRRTSSERNRRTRWRSRRHRRSRRIGDRFRFRFRFRRRESCRRYHARCTRRATRRTHKRFESWRLPCPTLVPSLHVPHARDPTISRDHLSEIHGSRPVAHEYFGFVLKWCVALMTRTVPLFERITIDSVLAESPKKRTPSRR